MSFCQSWSGSKPFANCFFRIYFFQKKIFQYHYQSVKRFGSRSGLTFCRSAADIISRQQKSPLEKKELKLNSPLFNLILRQQFFSYVGTGLPGLNQYQAKINVSCSRTQHSDAGEAWTRSLSASSQALYHWATVLL